MGVIVNGMDMPDGCAVCPFVGHRFENLEDGSHFIWVCSRGAIEKVIGKTGRRADCPLSYIPDKHGRLIDADKIIKGLEEVKKNHGNLTSNAVEYARLIIKMEPTVVEREDGK